MAIDASGKKIVRKQYDPHVAVSGSPLGIVAYAKTREDLNVPDGARAVKCSSQLLTTLETADVSPCFTIEGGVALLAWLPAWGDGEGSCFYSDHSA